MITFRSVRFPDNEVLGKSRNPRWRTKMAGIWQSVVVAVVGIRLSRVDNGVRLGWSSKILRAAAGVAHEPNPGMTVSATVVADVWGRWVGILSLFPPRSFLFHLFVSLLLCFPHSCLHSLTPAAAILGKRLPAASVDVCEFEVALAVVLVAQRGAAYWAATQGKLSIQDILWNTTIFHAVYMNQPSQSVLRQHEVHVEGACLFKYSSLGDLVLPGDAEDMAQASEVKVLQAVFLSCVR